MSNKQGSVLVFVMILMVVVGGFVGALVSMVFSYHQASSEALDRQGARLAAESGLGFYLLAVASDPDHFVTHPSPHTPVPVGEGTFELMNARPAGAGEWTIDIVGTYGRATYPLSFALGKRPTNRPRGLVVAGTGVTEDLVLKVGGNGGVASFDSTQGPFDPNAPGTAQMLANGSVRVSGSSEVNSDITATGTIEVEGSAIYAGTPTENASTVPIAPADTGAFLASQGENDNAALAGIFGAQWTPLAGAQNYGDLVITAGNYVVPTGVYRFRTLRLGSGSTVMFDTSAGPAVIVYAGDGTNDALSLSSDATVLVDPGTTAHGLSTILGPNIDFSATSNSIFGQAIGHADSAAFSQIAAVGDSGSINLGGTASVYGFINAPTYTLSVAGSSRFYGAAVVQTATIMGSSGETPKFLVDDSLEANAAPDPANLVLRARWQGSN